MTGGGKIFHGWRMVAAGAVIQLLHAGLLTQAFGAYVAVLSEEMGWSKTALSGGAALQSVEGALLGPALGWLMDRFGARSMMQVGIVAFGLGFIALGFIDTISGFYTAVLVIAIGTSLSGYFPLSVTLVHWFRRKRARALSTMGIGFALGGLVVPLVAASIGAFGWRATAIGSGVLALVVGLPLVRLFHRHPSDVGEVEDGEPAPVAAAGETPLAEEPQKHFTAFEALRTPAFWLLNVGHGLALLVVTAVNVHAISHISKGLGYSVAQASLFLSVMTGAQVGGLLAGATMGDCWDKRWASGLCMIGHCVGLLLLAYAIHPAMIVGFCVLHGFAWGLRGPFMQAIRADYFGVTAIGMIMGVSAFLIALGQVGGPMVAGAFADAHGDYRMGFTVLALLAGCGFVAFMLAKKPK
jgi:sugar phosphate permease